MKKLRFETSLDLCDLSYGGRVLPEDNIMSHVLEVEKKLKIDSSQDIFENITVKDKNIINSLKCKKAIRQANQLIKNQGRMLVRKSGTEPKIRIMGESDNKKLLQKCISIIKKTIR